MWAWIRENNVQNGKIRLTVEEMYATLKNSDLPTVFVEGKDDIIFYRAVEKDIGNFSIDMFPAGNKDAVLSLRERVKTDSVEVPTVFIVDKDLWAYPECMVPNGLDDLVTTNGYSIENDLFIDGDLEFLMDDDEIQEFKREISKFSWWYALSVSRNLRGVESPFRAHPQKVLDDPDFYETNTELSDGEVYPDELFNRITSNYASLLRGKSLFALVLRQLSAKRREVKFSGKQLMEIGAKRKGSNFKRIQNAVKAALEQRTA